MCAPASFVLTKDKVFWSDISDSHENIIEEYKLNEMVNGQPCFVRIEITPENNDYTKDPTQWVYRVDQDLLPKWYDADDCEKRGREALKNWCAKKLKTSGEHVVTHGNVIASGSASVKAFDSASVKAFDSASVIAYGFASVIAFDSAFVSQCVDNATVRLYEQARFTGELVSPFAAVLDCRGDKVELLK